MTPGPPQRHAPGRTSSIQLPGGTMTLQTEVSGTPPQIVTIVVFRGRVLRRSVVALGGEVETDLESAVRRAHNDSERGLLRALQDVHPPPQEHPGAAPVEPPTASLLFVMATEALARRDRGTAISLLEAVQDLIPDDRRVQLLLAELTS